MPKFERDAVRDLISNQEIKAVSFDTNVIESFVRSGNLRHPMLKALGALNDKGISIVVSEVVAREGRKHFHEAMMQAHRDAKTAINKLGRLAGKTNDAITAAATAFPSETQQAESLDEEFSAFLEMLQADVVKAEDYASFSQILDLYFEGKPPFANAKKKAEFPDAIAISSLEAWSDQEGAIIAVSNDGDWKSAFEASETVHVVPDLRAALAIFQEDDKLAEAFADAFRKSDETILTALKSAIGSSLDDLDVEIDFSTDWQVDVELTGATVSEVSAPIDLETPEIIGADADTVTFSIPVNAKVHMMASASFSVNDPIDRDDVTIGSHDISTTVEHTYEVTVRLISREDGKIEIEEVSVIPNSRLDYVDFDYVTFSPGDDWYE